MKTNKLILGCMVAFLAQTFTSCKDDPSASNPNPIDTAGLAYTSGVFIINEGNFGVGNSSIDFYNRDSNSLTRNIFQQINGRPLGDVAQSMTIFRNKGYIVLNGSGKMEIINANNFSSVASISGFSSPRYFVGTAVNTGYVTDWVSNSIKEIDLATNSIKSTIAVGTGPEGAIKFGNYLYVANSGGYELDSTVSVIDLTTKTEIKKILVGHAPISFAIDAQNQLWVLCRGDYGSFTTLLDDSKGKLVKINTNSNEVAASFEIGQQGDHPDKLAISKAKDALYYNGSYGGVSTGIFKMGISETNTPSVPFINGYFYGIGVDPVDGSIYAADPIDFNQNGIMWRYQDNTSTLLDSFRVGIIPNGIHVEF